MWREGQSHTFFAKVAGIIPSKWISFQMLEKVQVCSKKTVFFFWQIHVKTHWIWWSQILSIVGQILQIRAATCYSAINLLSTLNWQMTDNGIVVMIFLSAYKACKGALRTVALIPPQRQTYSFPSLSSLQMGVQDRSRGLGKLRFPLARAPTKSGVLHCSATHQDPAIAFHFDFSLRKTKLATWLSYASNAKIHLSCWFQLGC